MTEDQKKAVEEIKGKLESCRAQVDGLHDDLESEKEDSDEDAEDVGELDGEIEHLEEASNEIDDAIVALNNL